MAEDEQVLLLCRVVGGVNWYDGGLVGSGTIDRYFRRAASKLDARAVLLDRMRSRRATNASLFLDCEPDIRITTNGGEYGDLPTRVIFLERDGPLDLQMGGLAHYDGDQNIIEIHNTFKRCIVNNNGGVDLHNIKIGFEFHGHGPVQNLVTKYPYTVNIADLSPNNHAIFSITSGTMLAFYTLAPTTATAQTTVDPFDKPVQLGESDYTKNRMVYDALMPSQPRKTAWKLSPCHWQGAAVMHNGTVTIHLPKSCAGTPWITPPINP